jgi:hypothetical protein
LNYKSIDKNGQVYYSWSVHKNVLNKLPKTSNSIEGWHRALNAKITHKNPSLVELIQELKAIQNVTEIQILRSLYEEAKSYNADEIVERAYCEYKEYYGVQFLEKISFILTLKYV